MLEAFECEFWAGHYDRSRLLIAPLRVLAEALSPSSRALLESLLAELGGSSAPEAIHVRNGPFTGGSAACSGQPRGPTAQL